MTGAHQRAGARQEEGAGEAASAAGRYSAEPEAEPLSVSVVVPVYSGADYLEALALELGRVRTEWQDQGRPFRLIEAIFVDDAAIDASPALLDRLAASTPWIRVVHLSRNFGQHPATIAGLLHSAGDWVITLDEDLQHDPRHFLALLERAATRSADVVYARPLGRVHGSLLRDLGSRGYKRLLALFTGNRFIRAFNSFRLIRGPIARAAASVCSHETYFDIALGWFSDRVEGLELSMVDRRFVQSGKSGYSLLRLLGHARRMVVSSHNKVLRASAIVGMLCTLLGVVLGAWVLVQRLLYPASIAVRGWTSVFLAILFFGGLSVFLLGVVLELLTNVLLHSQGKPAFFAVDRGADARLVADFQRRGQGAERADPRIA